jgi:hypothetical protein
MKGVWRKFIWRNFLLYTHLEVQCQVGTVLALCVCSRVSRTNHTESA